MEPKEPYPKKLYYKINEIATIVGVEDYVLRYWETRFPMLKPEKQRGDQRRYRQKDIDLLLHIQHLVHDQNMPINEAVAYLKQQYRSSSSGVVKIHAKPPERPSIPQATTTAQPQQSSAPPPATAKPPQRADLASLLKELEEMKKEYQGG